MSEFKGLEVGIVGKREKLLISKFTEKLIEETPFIIQLWQH
jgi:hypothetical protein